MWERETVRQVDKGIEIAVAGHSEASREPDRRVQVDHAQKPRVRVERDNLVELTIQRRPVVDVRISPDVRIFGVGLPERVCRARREDAVCVNACVGEALHRFMLRPEGAISEEGRRLRGARGRDEEGRCEDDERVKNYPEHNAFLRRLCCKRQAQTLTARLREGRRRAKKTTRRESRRFSENTRRRELDRSCHR